jgi:ABC-type nitrate/sulfonate/bicarbonate transport system permease component
MRDAVHRVFFGALGIVLAVLLWDAAVRFEWVDPVLLSDPATVAGNLVDNWTEPGILSSPLAQATVATLKHFALGFGLSVVIGVTAGAAIGMVRVLRSYGGGLLRLFQYTPPAAVLPLLILYMYRGPGTIAAFVVIASVWPILIHTKEALENRDPVLDAAARSVGWRGPHLFTRVLLPQITSEVSIGIRIASVIGLLSTILGEFLAGDDGLGFEILLAKQAFRYGDMYPALATLAVIGFVINLMFRYLQALATRWRTHGALASTVSA